MNKGLTVIICTAIICASGATVAICYKFIGAGEDMYDGTVVQPMQQVMSWPKKVALGIKDLFQAKVTISNSSVSLQQEDIAELALLKRKTLCYTKYESRYLGGYAALIIRGEFVVKAGYDLNKGCNITFDEKDRTVRIVLPQPQILSIETVSQSIFHRQDDFLKQLQPDEVATAYEQNGETARREAVELGVTEEAEARMQERVKDIFRGIAEKVVVNDSVIEIPQYGNDEIIAK
jgi:hypothetical protein